MAPRRNNTGGGFTLIEVIIVVVLLGILAAVTMPLLGSTDGVVALAAARHVAYDLEIAQSEAIKRQAPITVAFDVANGRYTIQDANGVDLIPEVTLFEAVGSKNVTITSAAFGGGASVTFSADGEPVQAAGGEVISSDSAIVVTKGTKSVTIRVKPVTGRIYVDR